MAVSIAWRVFHWAVAAVILIGYLVVLPQLVKPHWNATLTWLNTAAGGFEAIAYALGAFLLQTFTLVVATAMFLVLYWGQWPVFEAHRVLKAAWPWARSDAPHVVAKFWRDCWDSMLLGGLNMALGTTAAYLSFKPEGHALHLPDELALFPDTFTLLWQLAVFCLIDDFCFYWAHRLMHQAPFYAAWHKPHHTWTHTTIVAVLHVHPAEFLLTSIIVRPGDAPPCVSPACRTRRG